MSNKGFGSAASEDGTWGSDYEINFVSVNYHRDKYPNLPKIEIKEKGDWIDLCCAEDVVMKQGEVKIIPLGISMEIPEGYTARLLPRSSTPLKYGIMMANSEGIIDESYCGDNDIWGFIAYAIRDTVIPANTRIAQFRFEEKMKKEKFTFEEVESLGNSNRGGFGSTGN
jgi:dUTP pyrophosphatase